MLLITGATGTVGRPLVELLIGAGAPVRAVSRDPAVAELPDGVELICGDLSQPESIASALAGVTALFLNPRAVGTHAVELLRLAREHAVAKVVTLSAANVDDDLDQQPSRSRGDRNKEVEEAALNSGLQWVSLRPGTLAVNTLHAWGAQIAAGDIVRGPYPSFAEAPIHEQDLAEIAVRAMLTDELVGHKLQLTGPQSLTHEQMITIVGEVVGRPLRYQQIPAPTARQNMIAEGFVPALADALLAWWARGADRPALVANQVQQILGTPARPYADWVADHASAFHPRSASR
jgi:uncharacterized protein YbjT (DUF2867 family)